ncbi:hypothetical protein Anapl_17678 [Anas platyrhynchos]|uniref:Uncharacterized protein n=1 Tax=Anas platyrhynchos TaxID=8839 RepID=R0KKL8_ANAPL|nr:hypothetical protein Anapl_17678 [Anas platyrhynchos]
MWGCWGGDKDHSIVPPSADLTRGAPLELAGHPLPTLTPPWAPAPCRGCAPRAGSGWQRSLSSGPSDAESTKRVFPRHWMFLFVPRPWKSLRNPCQLRGLTDILRRSSSGLNERWARRIALTLTRQDWAARLLAGFNEDGLRHYTNHESAEQGKFQWPVLAEFGVHEVLAEPSAPHGSHEAELPSTGP